MSIAHLIKDIPLDELTIHPEYQRPTESNPVLKAEEFFPFIAGALLVLRLDGVNFLTDGGHRAERMRQDGITEATCVVQEVDDEEELGYFFAVANNRKNISPRDAWRIEANRGVEPHATLYRGMASRGHVDEVPPKSLITAADLHGTDVALQAVDVVKDAFPREKIQAAILLAVARNLSRGLDPARIRQVLSALGTPTALIRAAGQYAEAVGRSFASSNRSEFMAAVIENRVGVR